MARPATDSRRAASDAASLRVIRAAGSADAQESQLVRQHLARELDVRLRAELAYRRKLTAVIRQVLRVASLHVLDGAMVVLAGLLVERISGIVSNADTALIGLVGLSLVALHTQSAYQPGPARRELRRLVAAMGITGMVLLATPLLTGSAVLSPSAVVLFVALSVGLLAGERWAVDAIVRQVYARGIGLRRALVVASPRELDGILHDLRGDRTPDQHVVGYVTPDATNSPGALGSLAELPRILDEVEVQEVILSSPVAAKSVEQVTSTCFERGIAVLVLPWGREHLHGWAEPVRIGHSVAYHLHPARLRIPSLAVKRAMDLAVSSTALVVLAPFIGIIAACIKLESPGPVFFKQRRVGLGGREFTIWKFRSMRAGADARVEQLAHLNQYPNRNLFKVKDDPRITRVGRVLRRFSLDELPQLVNIVRGEMSLVGPRPPLPREVLGYDRHHFVRLTVVPGLSGPWQVAGRNLISDFEEVIRIERDYIDEWTLGLDVKILAKTMFVVLSGKGAY